MSTSLIKLEGLILLLNPKQERVANLEKKIQTLGEFCDFLGGYMTRVRKCQHTASHFFCHLSSH